MLRFKYFFNIIGSVLWYKEGDADLPDAMGSKMKCQDWFVMVGMRLYQITSQTTAESMNTLSDMP